MKSFFRYLLSSFVFLIMAAFLYGCPKTTPKETYDPSPVIHYDGKIFTGGMITIEEEQGHAQDITLTELTYFNGNHWVILGKDSGLPADSDKRTDKRIFWWDIQGLKPGPYLLRAEMYEENGGYGVATLEMMIAEKPRGNVVLKSVTGEGVMLSAEKIFDPYESQLQHKWLFASGETFTESQAFIPATETEFPLVFRHIATNNWGASYVDSYILLSGGILLSLLDHSINVNLGLWEQSLLDIIAEKTKLKARLSPANKKRIDDANSKLKEAAKKIKEAKIHLAKKPPNEKAVKKALKEADKLIKEAIDILDKIDQEKVKIEENIKKLQGIKDVVGVTLLETAYLLDRINDLVAIIVDKKAIKGLAGNAKKVQDQVIKLLEEAKGLLDGAKADLLKSPPDVENAKDKVDKAKSKVKEAGKAIEKLKPPVKALTDNIEKLKQLYLKLGFLSGKLWLLGQIGLSSPHADIPVPDLTRLMPTQYIKPKDIQMGVRGDPQGDDGWEDAVLYHELDHHFLWQKNKQNLEGGHHWYDEDLAKAKGDKAKGMKLAWSEGWANFSSGAKRKDPHYLDEDEEKRPADTHFTPEKDLENDQCKNPGDKKMHPLANTGPAVEGSVSGILWDIFDGVANGAKDQDGDGVSIKFIWIWKAINEKPTPENINDFYKNLKKVLFDNGVAHEKAKLKKIFTDHGV